MSASPHGVDIEASLEEVAEEMISKKVRRLVVNEGVAFVGVISVGELAGLISDEQIAQTLYTLASKNATQNFHHEKHAIPGQYLG